MRDRIKDFKYASSKKYDGMMGRCYRPSDRTYKSYGGRGIKVCGDWIRDIANFRNWLTKELLSLGITKEYFLLNSRRIQLDRIDVDGHYMPSNCRLVNCQTNTRNRRVAVVKSITSAEGELIDLKRHAITGT